MLLRRVVWRIYPESLCFTRTATPVRNGCRTWTRLLSDCEGETTPETAEGVSHSNAGDKPRQTTARSGKPRIRMPFLNGEHRSVNRKAESGFDTLSGGLPWTLVD